MGDLLVFIKHFLSRSRLNITKFLSPKFSATDKKDKDLLTGILTNLKLRIDNEDIDTIHQDIKTIVLEGLNELPTRLYKDNRRNNSLSTLFEIYLTANIIRNLKRQSKYSIEYEPQTYQNPPDLKIQVSNTIIYVQIKSAKSLERDNRLMNLIKAIKNKTDSIKINKRFSLSFSENLDIELEDIVNFIEEKAKSGKDNKKYTYHSHDTGSYIDLIFQTPENNQLKNLSLDIGSDTKVINETNKSKNQLTNSLKKGVEAFKWDITENVINLIAIELPTDFGDIDITEAMYGTEHYLPSLNKSRRSDDGFYNITEIKKKITGIVVLQRKEPRLAADYWKVLCMNKEVVGNIQDVQEKIITIFQCDKIWPYNKAPSSNNSSFFDLDTSKIKLTLQ